MSFMGLPKTVQLEGVVASACLTQDKWHRYDSDPAPLPVVYIRVINKSDGAESPITMGLQVNNIFEMRMIERGLVGQEVRYEEVTRDYKHDSTHSAQMNRKLSILSGDFEGLVHECSHIY